MRKLSTLTSIIAVLLSLLISGLSCAVNTDSSQPAPSFVLTSPAIMAVNSDEAARLENTHQVPDSEMTHIPFSLEWVIENDVFHDDPFIVKITFPASWVNDPPPVPEGETPVELSVPTLLFNVHNESQNPAEITVVFPNRYFNGMPEPQFMPGASSPQLIREPPGINFFTQPGTNPPAEELWISAISGPLDWSLIWDVDWLNVSSTRGNATSQKEKVTVSADTTGLAAGTYSAYIILHREGTDWTQEIPIRLFITTADFSQAPDVKVEQGSGDAFKQGIKPGETTVIQGFLDDGPKHNPRGGGYYGKGDPCLLIQGELLNTTGKLLTVDFWADGYDANGQQVSWTLSQGPIMGIAQKDVAAQSARPFELILSWSENVRLFKISANIHHWPE